MARIALAPQLFYPRPRSPVGSARTRRLVSSLLCCPSKSHRSNNGDVSKRMAECTPDMFAAIRGVDIIAAIQPDGLAELDRVCRQQGISRFDAQEAPYASTSSGKATCRRSTLRTRRTLPKSERPRSPRAFAWAAAPGSGPPCREAGRNPVLPADCSQTGTLLLGARRCLVDPLS